MRLLVRRFFHFEGGGGFFNFAVELFAGFAEFVDALSEALGQFRQTLGPEEDENDEEDEQDLRPSRSGEGKWYIHNSETKVAGPGLQPRMHPGRFRIVSAESLSFCPA